MKRLPSFIVSMALLLSPVGSAFAQVDAETVLARVNGLPAKERMDALVAGARKEGALEWYGSLQVADVKDLIERFKKKISVHRGSVYPRRGNQRRQPSADRA